MIRLYLILILSTVISFCKAQSWTNFNESNSGLLDNIVTCANVDIYGNLWVGFGGNWQIHGVQKFDGTNWTNFTTVNSPLPNDDVRAIGSDALGNVWFGTNGGGLAKFDGATWSIYDTSNSSILRNSIFYLKIDNMDHVWMSHPQYGISVFDGTDFSFLIYPQDSVPNNCPSDFYLKNSSQVWLSFLCNGGLVKINLSDTTSVYLNSSNSNMPSNYVNFIDIDKQENLWISYSFGYYGVSKFDGFTITNYNSFGTSTVGGLAIDTNDIVYLGVRGNALYKYDSLVWSQVPSPLPSTGVTTLTYCDRYNRIWWGEQFTGLWVSDISNGVLERGGHEVLEIYPNPVLNQFQISLPSPLNQTSQIIIRDIIGREVSRDLLQTQIVDKQFDISKFSSGIYFLTLQNESGVVTRRFVKQ